MAIKLSIKDTANEQKLFANRATIVALIMFFLFALLIFRFFSLQILEHDTYQTKSEKNRIQMQPISPPRGLINDRNGELLAGNITVYNLAVIPERVDSMEDTLNRLKKFIDISENDVKNFTKRMSEKRGPFDSVPL